MEGQKWQRKLFNQYNSFKEGNVKKFVVLRMEDYQNFLEQIEDLEDLVSILEAKLKAKPENYEEWDVVRKEIA